MVEPLLALHGGGKVGNGSWVRQITALGDIAHHQMLIDQPFGQSRFSGTEAEAGPQLAGNTRTGNGMIFRASLGNIVQQHGQINHLAVNASGAQKVMRAPMRVSRRTAFNFAQQADGAQ